MNKIIITCSLLIFAFIAQAQEDKFASKRAEFQEMLKKIPNSAKTWTTNIF